MIRQPPPWFGQKTHLVNISVWTPAIHTQPSTCSGTLYSSVLHLSNDKIKQKLLWRQILSFHPNLVAQLSPTSGKNTCLTLTEEMEQTLWLGWVELSTFFGFLSIGRDEYACVSIQGMVWTDPNNFDHNLRERCPLRRRSGDGPPLVVVYDYKSLAAYIHEVRAYLSSRAILLWVCWVSRTLSNAKEQ